MKRFATLFARELRRRLPTHLVSLGLGLAAVVTPSFAGGVSGAHAVEVRGAAAVGVAVLWSFALAFIEGLGFLAGDLRERRLGFDFRLPISSISIWAGRLTAAALSIALAALTILGVTALAGADLAWGLQAALELVQGNSGLVLHRPPLIVALLLLAVLLSLDLVGLALASRKGWLALDFASAITFKTFAFLAIVPLWRAGAETSAGNALVAATAGGLLALLAATARQVASGRTEPDRAHRAFSITFALVALSTAGALSAWSWWYRTPSPGDLVESNLSASPLTEDLVWIGGRARHRAELVHAFLLEPRTGRFLRLPEQHPGVANARARLSLDRSRVAWLAVERRTTRSWTSRVRFADLPRGFAEPRESGIEWDGVPLAWALSPDGSRVGSVWRNSSEGGSVRLRTEELESGGSLQSFTIARCGSPGALVFLDDETMLYGCGWAWRGDDMIHAYTLRLDLETGETAFAGQTPYSDRPIDAAYASAPGRWFEPPPESWSRTTGGSGRLHLEARSFVEIPPPAPLEARGFVSSARFLANGELAVAWIAHRSSVLAVYDESGELLRAVPTQLSLPLLLGQSADSLFTGVPSREYPRGPLTTTLYRLSLSGSEVAEVSGKLTGFPASSDASPTTIFRGPDGKVLWLDLSTGKLVPLFAAF